MEFSRSVLFVPTILVAASAAAGTPLSTRTPSFCAALLSGASDADGASSPETALAAAWRSLVEGELSDLAANGPLLGWLGEIVEGGELLAAAREAPSAALAEGLEELSRLVVALVEAGGVDFRVLSRQVAQTATAILEEHGLRHSQVEERHSGRSALKEPVLRVTLGEVPILERPQLLADGRIAVVAGRQLVFLDRDGAVLSRVSLPRSLSTPVVFLPTGDLVAGTSQGEVLWLDLAGRELHRVRAPVRHADRIHSLQDGSILLESYANEPMTIVNRLGQSRTVFSSAESSDLLGQLSDGRLLVSTGNGALRLVPLIGEAGSRLIPITFQAASLSAVPLRNGTIFVKSNLGDYVLLDRDGNPIHRESGGMAGLSKPVELPDGGVVFGSLKDGAVFLNADGTFRARTPMDISVGLRTTVLSNGIVVMSGEGRRLHFFEPTGRALGSLMIAPDADSPFRGVRSQLLEVPSGPGSALGFVGLVDGDLLRIDLEAASGLFDFPNDFFSSVEVK